MAATENAKRLVIGVMLLAALAAGCYRSRLHVEKFETPLIAHYKEYENGRLVRVYHDFGKDGTLNGITKFSGKGLETVVDMAAPKQSAGAEYSSSAVQDAVWDFEFAKYVYGLQHNSSKNSERN